MAGKSFVPVLLVSFLACSEPSSEPVAWSAQPGVVAGDLVVVQHSPDGDPDTPANEPVLRTTWANDRSYNGMEDNDIRGYLDGRFKWGWNQPGQVHVRVGRRRASPEWGELELFRVLYEWRDLTLPPGAEITDASLRLTVEHPDANDTRPVRLLLFAVKRAFNPGQGGVSRDNVSPPGAGEVWWNDADYGSEAWALPGANFASDDPDADTGPQPLAFDVWSPGDSIILFQSDRLATYLQDQVDAGEPLRLMLRLASLDEDTPGTVLTVYSGSTGDDWTTDRRPQLSVAWRPPPSARMRQWSVLLDYGALWVTPRLERLRGEIVTARFQRSEGSIVPAIEIRGGVGDSVSPWYRNDAPKGTDWDWVQVRLSGGSHPLRFGNSFKTTLRDTWILTGAPREQKVPFVFFSPTGRTDTVMAEYVGDYTWFVEYVPQELGPWKYSWSNSFTEQGYESPIGTIDVVAGEMRPLLQALRDLRGQASQSDLTKAASTRASVQFMRLERAVIERLGPRGFRGSEGVSVRALLDSVRVALGGESVPKDLPLVPAPPPAWITNREGGSAN